MSDLFGKIKFVNGTKSKNAKSKSRRKKSNKSNSKREIGANNDSSSEDEAGCSNGNVVVAKPKPKPKSRCFKEYFSDVYHLEDDIRNNYQVNSDVRNKIKKKLPNDHDSAMSLLILYFIRRSNAAAVGNTVVCILFLY